MANRYKRQEIFSWVGKQGQKKIKDATVVVIGLGAIGGPVAELLARAGVGKLIIIDRDTVEVHNLQRQTLYGEADCEKPKAHAAKKHLEQINSKITIEAYDEDLTQENITKLITQKTTVIIDGTDNLETRFLLNDYALKNNIPFIYAAAVQDRGFIMNIIKGKTPCLQCLYQEPTGVETCATAGVLNSITSLVAAIETQEAIKIILGKESVKELIHVTGKTIDVEKITRKYRKNCPSCQGVYHFLDEVVGRKILKFCGSGNYQVRFKERKLEALKKQLESVQVKDLGMCLQIKNMLIFPNRCLVRAKSEKEAKSKVAKYIGN